VNADGPARTTNDLAFAQSASWTFAVKDNPVRLFSAGRT
jgi:hypothetical protein